MPAIIGLLILGTPCIIFPPLGILIAFLAFLWWLLPRLDGTRY